MAVLDTPPPASVARPALKAAGLAVIGMGIIGAADNVMPEVARHIGLAQFHAVRSAMALMLLPFVLAWAGVRLRPVRPWGVIGRSLLLAVGMGCYFACLGVLPVAQALAGVFTAPLWIMLVSRLGGARVDGGTAALILAGFAGCLMVVQPDPQSLGWLAIFPLAAGFFYGMAGKVTRTWTRDENVWTLVGVYLAILGGGAALALLALDPASTDYISRGWAPMPWHVVGLCLLQAVVALSAVALLTRAYQLAAPAFVGAFEYTVLIVAAAVGFVLWGHGMNGLGMAGVAVILASGAALAWRGDRA